MTCIGSTPIPFDMYWMYSNSIQHVLVVLKFHSTCNGSILILFDMYWEDSNSILMYWEYPNYIRRVIGVS